MMAFLTHIFPLTSTYLQNNSSISELDKVLVKLSSEKWNKFVIVGPDRADKTALAFQAAVSAAASGARVTYICTHPLKRLPNAVHGMMTPELAIMRLVDFLYLEESDELLSWCAKIHTKAKLPNLIVIEDILTYATQINENNIERSLAKLCAIISDAVSWIESQDEKKRCQILMTAPTRILSLNGVLAQFNIMTALYSGPEKEELHSKVCYNVGDHSLIIQFLSQKDSIMMTSIKASLKVS
ncbi:uncharacterized protein LOC131931501 [Physella acuta]|uniref:uncharacterized protein LOC131931501 n=1 Tax=Physella acuta TaxID=109671 RepID=UPI0027DDB6F6|nr:uncharacterized protein LOC131931501 [Physella acuta]XP_059144300.1 uncharacterized protein LOC131931501 [Physella acuta]XP_059144301.1 uncharacterized protein LOC131931501 [Physella acuta]